MSIVQPETPSTPTRTPLVATITPGTSPLTTPHSTPIADTTASSCSPSPNSNSSSPTTCISRGSSTQHDAVDTDSGKSSSCSPGLLDCSFDSGIAVEVTDMQLHKRIQQCKRILTALERNKESYRLLRERLSKITERKNKKLQDTKESQQFCNVCCADIRIDERKSYVTCCNCKKYICRGIKCADWIPKTAEWECQLCQSSKDSMAHTSSWVAEQISFNQHKYVYPIRARSEIYIPIGDCNDALMQFESVSQIGANSVSITAEQKIKIREYVEEIVASLLGGSLDSIAVTQMSKSENYLQRFHKYHSKLSKNLLNLENALCCKALTGGDLPAIINGRNAAQVATAQPATAESVEQQPSRDFSDISEVRLRQLIQSIIAETLGTSGPNGHASSAVSEVTHEVRSNGGPRPLTNGDVVRRHRTEHYFEPKIYHDLLATAVLNKITDKQNNGRRLSESTPDLSGHNVDPNYNVENASTTSGSSIEPRSDCSYTDNEQMLNVENLNAGNSTAALLTTGRESALSDYIATHMVPLPDLSVPPTESEEDDYASVTSSALGEGTWEDNWLFKRKRTSLNTSVTTGSTGMLVPAPKEDVRAQIGDKTADEVSDLSELGSETDESSLDIIHGNLDPLNDRLLSKHLIGGENTKMVLDELIESTSIVSATSLAESEPQFTETKNKHILVTVNTTEAINANVNQTIGVASETAIVPPPQNFTDANNETSTSAPLSGSIAEREYKKWYNAVEMPNNPYAPEALKKRITGSHERFIDLPNISPTTEVSPIELMRNSSIDMQEDNENDKENDVQRYSRDYYINDGKQVTTPTTTSPSKCSTLVMRTPAESEAEHTMPITNITDDPTTDDIIINEVIPHGMVTHGMHTSSSNRTNHIDNHWTQSTPVRRCSSLKFINDQKSHYNINVAPEPNNQTKSLYHHHHHQQQHHSDHHYNQCLPPRANTSASHYNDNDNDDDDDRSWKSASAYVKRSHSLASTLPKRRTLSSHSFNSTASGNSFNSSASKKRSPPNANVLSQFEKQLLHKDLKRNSFRAISATTKDFVMNPLFEADKFFSINGESKLSLKTDTDEQVDSGVDSCLNGFSETSDPKHSNNSLLF